MKTSTTLTASVSVTQYLLTENQKRQSELVTMSITGNLSDSDRELVKTTLRELKEAEARFIATLTK